jgi:membrane protein YdbS with pleckstrin-like domain
MKFIKKKNFLTGEELLYTPQLHWMYFISPMVFIVILIIMWVNTGALVNYMELPKETYDVFYQIINKSINYIFLTLILFVLLYLVRRILLYLNMEYGITNKRLIIKKGIIRVSVTEIFIDRIESIYCLQGIFGRIFNYGSVCISGIGGRMPVFRKVYKPYSIRRKVADIIEKNKTITVVHGDLPKPAVKPKPEPELKEEPIYRFGTFVRILPEGSK